MSKMNKDLKDLTSLYESIGSLAVKGVNKTTKGGELEGSEKAKSKGLSGSGPEGAKNVDKAKEAPANLTQGKDPVEKSKKKSHSGISEKRNMASTFDDLFNATVKEAFEEGDVEGNNFNDEAGDFAPGGGVGDEMGDEGGDMEASEGDKFAQLADLFSQAAELFSSMAGEHGAEGELGAEEELGEPGMEEELPEPGIGEAVEMSAAPNSVGKVTSKEHMNAKGVKVVKKSVNSSAAGKVDSGKPKQASQTTLGPKTSLKANGSGAAVDGKGASAFE